MELPDWLRGVALLGQDGADYRILAADREGRLYILVVGVDDVGAASVLRTDDAGRLITLLRGKDGNLLAVDDSGYLTAVLKGQFGGALNTISVDAAGRLEAFVLDDESQWGDVIKTGNAELAARLGSPRTWDWRGQTALFDDFSRGRGNLATDQIGTGADISLDPTYWQTGGYSLRLTGGSDSDRVVRVTLTPETPVAERVGVVACFSYLDYLETFTVTVDGYYNGSILRGAVRYNRGTDYVQYLNAAGSWVNLVNPYFASGASAFHRIKLVVDFGLFTYRRILVADQEFGLGGQDLYVAGSGALSSLYVKFELKSRSGHNDMAWLDHYVVTVNEPT